MNNTNSKTIVLTSALAALTACGAATDEKPELIELSSQSAALTAVENTERTLNGIIDAGGFLSESSSLAETLNGLGGEADCPTVDCPDNQPCAEVETTCEEEGTSEADLARAKKDIEDGVAELVEHLRTRVFIPGNLEAETDTSVTYKLGPDLLCDDVGEADSASNATPTAASTSAPEPSPEDDVELDADCVKEVEKAQPRLVLTSTTEGDVDITLQLTSKRFEPAVLQLHQDRLAIRVDLAEGLAALDELGDEDLSKIKKLDGALELGLVRNGELDYSVVFNVLEDFLLSVEDDEGSAVDLAVGKSNPTVELRADGNARSLSVDYDLAALNLTAPLALLAEAFVEEDDDDAYYDDYTYDDDNAEEVADEDVDKTYTGVIDVLLAGLSGGMTYTGDSDAFEFTNLGLGDSSSTVKFNGKNILKLDLNPENGRHFDLKVASKGDDGATIAFSPTFDLTLAFVFSRLKDQIDDLPSFLLDDTMRFWFEGDDPKIEVDDQMRVVSGTLHMTSTAHPEANLDVEAGMCLANASDEPTVDEEAESPMSAHEMLGELQVTTCE